MKTTQLSTLRGLALLASAASFVAVSPLLRADEAGQEHKESVTPMPATSAAALEKAHALHLEIAEQVKAKNLKPVHETAEKLTELLNTLPGLSKDLPADKLKRVDGTVKNLAKALDALHDAADEGKQAETEKELTAVDSLMKLLSAQYPAMPMTMPMPMPMPSAAVLEKAHTLHLEITEQVKAKNLKPVHETAEKLTELLNTLPGLSKDLPADKLKRVDGTVKNLAKALDALHDAADEGKQAETEKELTAVDSLMKLLSAQYTSGAMPAHKP